MNKTAICIIIGGMIWFALIVAFPELRLLLRDIYIQAKTLGGDVGYIIVGVAITIVPSFVLGIILIWLT